MYFCKAGDGVVDVQLIAGMILPKWQRMGGLFSSAVVDLHKSEVFKVSRRLGVPESILVAPPSADLWYFSFINGVAVFCLEC
jgi:NAD+ synthase (glutamine-hydrolysing)